MKVHLFPYLSAGEMYDRTQTDDSIKDGDLFVCCDCKVVGFLAKAWPVMLFGVRGEGEQLHLIEPGKEEKVFADYPGLREKALDIALSYNLENCRKF